ncbi:MAG TPA: hypothetical protein VGM17_17065 [Rhizomicrobium sp.]|jgi:hypothetical protein
MNKLPERAFAEASKLPEDQQEALAGHILEEIEAERGRDERFANSQDKLAELSRKASERIARGTTLPFDPRRSTPDGGNDPAI